MNCLPAPATSSRPAYSRALAALVLCVLIHAPALSAAPRPPAARPTPEQPQTVIVRHYPQPEIAPGAYEGLPAYLAGVLPELNPAINHPGSWYAFASVDQATSMPIPVTYFYVWRGGVDRLHSPSGFPSMPLRIPPGMRPGVRIPDGSVTLRDALGDPIPGAEVDILFAEPGDPPRALGLLATLTAGPDGRLTLPQVAGACDFRIRIRHADYGEAEADLRAPILGTCLVRRDSPAAARALRGRLLDPDGKPLAGILLTSRGFYKMPGGFGEGNFSPYDGAVRTAADGTFRIYHPPQGPGASSRDLIPPDSQCMALVEPPASLQIPRQLISATNDAPADIRLARGNRLRRFVFTDRSGEPVGPGTDVWLHREGVQFTAEAALRPQHFLPGSYTANVRSASSGVIDYGSIELTDQSPDVIVLRPPEVPSYAGRVVDATTGRPVAGALALLLASRGSDDPPLTAAHWQAIRALPPNAPPDPDALARFKGDTLLAYTLTSPDGSFTLTPSTAARTPLIIVHAERFTSAEWFDPTFTPATGAAIPDFSLFPAARVLCHFASDVPKVTVHPSIRLKTDPSPPPWAEEFNRLARHSPGKPTPIMRKIVPGSAEGVEVPAGAALTVSIGSHYRNEWRPLLLDIPPLAPGQEYVLDSQRFPVAPLVGVRILDSAGKPVEGLRVDLGAQSPDYPGQYAYQVFEATRADGVAYMFAPADEGMIAIITMPILTNLPVIVLQQPYSLAGNRDSPPLFTIQLTAEQEQQLKP